MSVPLKARRCSHSNRCTAAPGHCTATDRLPPAPPPAPVQANHLTRDEYAMNHPAGRIGKRLMLKVADIMSNLAPSRMSRLEGKDQARLTKKYTSALGVLIAAHPKVIGL